MSSPTNEPTEHNVDPWPENLKALSGAMHDLAQPLAVLQGLVEVALLQPQPQSQYQNTLENALEQTQRAIGALGYAQELVHIYRDSFNEHHCSAPQVFLECRLDLQCLFDERRILVEGSAVSTASRDIKGSRARVRQLFSYLLQMIVEICPLGARLRVDFQDGPDLVKLSIEEQSGAAEPNHAPRALSRGATRYETLLRAILRKTGGAMRLELEPFKASVELPTS